MHQQQKKTERMAEGQQAPQQQMSPEVQKKYEDFQKLQQSVSELVNKQSQLESQLNENTMVKEEFGKLDEESEVFKLRGPVLIKQDLEDAKQAVDGRLNFIKSNLDQLEKDVEAKVKEREKLREEIIAEQKKAQEAQKKQNAESAQPEQTEGAEQ